MLFLQCEKASFLFSIFSESHIFIAFFVYIKKMKKLPVFDQNHVVNSLEKS